MPFNESTKMAKNQNIAQGVLFTQNETEMTELTCGRTTARGKMTTGAGTHVGPRAKAIPT